MTVETRNRIIGGTMLLIVLIAAVALCINVIGFASFLKAVIVSLKLLGAFIGITALFMFVVTGVNLLVHGRFYG